MRLHRSLALLRSGKDINSRGFYPGIASTLPDIIEINGFIAYLVIMTNSLYEHNSGDVWEYPFASDDSKPI